MPHAQMVTIHLPQRGSNPHRQHTGQPLGLQHVSAVFDLGQTALDTSIAKPVNQCFA